MFAGLYMYLLTLILGFSFGAFKHIPNQRNTKGLIEALEQRHKSHKGMITHTAVVSYVVGTEKYYVKSSYQSSFFETGKKLVVCYNKDNPQKSFVRTGMVVYILMALSMIAGTAVIINGILGWLN